MGQVGRAVPVESYREMAAGAADPHYVAVKLSSGIISAIQVQWHDTTSAFTITPYSSLMESPDVPASAAAAPNLVHWHDESADLSFTGGVGAAAGSDVVHIGNNGAKWILLRFTVTAASVVSVLVHGKD